MADKDFGATEILVWNGAVDRIKKLSETLKTLSSIFGRVASREGANLGVVRRQPSKKVVLGARGVVPPLTFQKQG